MTNQEIIDAALETLLELRESLFVPNPATRVKGGSTGNMALNALRMKVYSGYIVVYIDTTVAPYVPYTNEPWLAERWQGAKNPNEGWWEVFAQEFINRFNQKLGGKIT